MDKIGLALALLMISAPPPARAQAASDHGAAAKPAKGTCPCSKPGFKALTDKARAVEEYWNVRRESKIAGAVGGSVGLLALLTGDSKAMNDAGSVLRKARESLDAARAKAVKLGGIKVAIDDDDNVEVLLEKGVDYSL